MAELKREVRGEIEANLVPPPQQNVWGEALKSVIQADASIQTSKLLKEQDLERDRQMNEGMQAQIEVQEATNRRTAEAATVFGDSSNIEKDGEAFPLSDIDKRDLDDVRSSMKRNKDGMMQGATTHTESLINQELILKRAIQRRPWLRDEFIKASQGFLGVDVYQRGYMALAENEAARLTANDAAAKAAEADLEERGKAIRADNFVTDYLAANPDDIEGARILARIQYNNADLARFYDERIGTERGEAYRIAQATRKNIDMAAGVAKSNNTITEARTAESVKKLVSEETLGFSKVTGDLLNDKSLWDETGTLLPEQQPQAQLRFDAMLQRTFVFQQELIRSGATPEVAKGYGDMQRATIESLMDVLSGKTGEKLTRARVEKLQIEAEVATMTQPAVGAVVLTLLKQVPGMDAKVAAVHANQMVGVSSGNSALTLKHLTGPSAGNVSTMLKDKAAELQDPAVTGNARAVAMDVMRSLGIGTVVNLSVIDPTEMAKTASAIGQARLQLEDWSRAFLATDNVGDKENAVSFFDSLGETDKQNMGGAFAKSIYTVQTALVNKTAINSDLASFRKNNEDGTPVLRWGTDGSILVVDQSAFNSPQEKAYLAEINQHNAFIKRSKAGEIIQSTLGRAPTIADRGRALATSFGVSGYASASKLVISASRAAVYGRDEGGAGKKPQGAQAPIGTRVYKADDQASRIGYAQGLRGAESGGNFNVQYGGKTVPVTEMTLGQVIAYQEAQIAQKKQSAIGAYQFTKDTLEGAMKRAGVSEDAKFDVATQNAIMRAHSNYLAETAKKVLGRDPSYGEMYLLHFQGEGDGGKMLAAGPDAPVDAWFSEKEKALNPAYAKAKTVGDLIAILEKKWS